MTNRTSRLALLALALLAGAARPALPAPAPLPMLSEAAAARDIRALLDAAYAADGPGAAVVVTRGGKTLFAGQRGMADIAAGRSISVENPFQLASITKSFTAALILELADEGKLSLDDPISKYVSGFQLPASGATIRNLLNHNSGIMDYSKVPNFIAANRDKHFTTGQLVAVMRDLTPVAAPGEKWEYNNGGYALLGAIVEKVTGQSWQQAMRERIVAPLGLTSIPLSGRPSGIALPYEGSDANASPLPVGEISVGGAAGSMIASAPDLARFFNALHHGKLVSPALYRQMTARAAMNDGTSMPYGFGFRIGRLLDSPTYYQGGAMRGARTETLYLPEQDIFVAVLANSETPRSQPRELALRMAAAVIGSPLPRFTETAVPLEQLRPLLGRYTGSEGPVRLLFERDGKLWLALGQSPAREVLAAGNDRFFFGQDELDWFEIKRDPAGKHHLLMHVAEAREPKDAVWTGDVASAAVKVDPALLKRLVGTYLAETGITLHVTVDQAGQLRMGQEGRDGGALRPTEGGQFAVDGSPMRVSFDTEAGRVTGLRLFRGARVLKAVRKN